MAAALLPAGGVALRGAPDADIGSRAARTTPIQAMHVEMTQDIVDDLLESVRSGQPPQIFFGRTPHLRYADKTHSLQTSSENNRHELYRASGAASDDALAFTSLINHSLIVQQAQVVTAGVDTALEQLKNSMAAISELKQANKTVVGIAGTPVHTPGHRRVPSKGSFVPAHLATSAAGSPRLSVPSSPMAKGSAPTSQPGGNRDVILNALRVPLIHLLAVQPSTEARLAETCRTSLANVRELLPKIAKQDGDKWELTNKSYRDLNPYKFPYKATEDREKAIDHAIRAFDRLRLTKDDKLWQILLPREERGQGKCLSRISLNVPEAKSAKPSTPLHKMLKQNDKKPVAKKQEEKKKEVKELEARPKKPVKEKVVKLVTSVKEKTVNGNTPKASTSKASTPKVTATAPANRYVPTESNKIRKKVVATDMNSSPRVKPNMTSRDLNRDPYGRRQKPAMPVNTKPKNPSPLSQSPPVNASDFDGPPVHKSLSTTAPATTPGHSDTSLKRKANELDSDIHNHGLAVKKAQVDRSTPNRTPTSINGLINRSTPSSTNSLKRKSDSSSSSSTPTTKVRKVTSIDTSLASRYPHHAQSPGASSASTTSPSVPSLSFRQTVELSQKFQKYYKKYEDLYWQLTESESAPTEAQRNDLLKMHKKLEEMKREIKSGAGVHR